MRSYIWLSLAIFTCSVAEDLPEEYEVDGVPGLMIKVIKPSPDCKVKAVKGDFVEVHYKSKIAPSSQSGKPGELIDESDGIDGMSHQLGSGSLIGGWERGMLDMCEGEARLITIPPEYAYGGEGYTHEKIVIPPNATMTIECELVKVIKLQMTTIHKPTDCEKIAELGSTLSVHYTLKIHESSLSGEKGIEMETSRNDKNPGLPTDPMVFQLGAGKVIPGWEQSLVGVCEGEKLELVVPPEFGYGEKGSEKIPPMATLHFDLEVVKIVIPNMFEVMDKDGNGLITMEELAEWFKTHQGVDDPAVVKDIFETEDKNKDGHIDWDEAPFPKGKKKEEL